MDFSFSNSNMPRQGSVLLADPFEDDVHFYRSVILLCTHDETGSFGLVLNNYVHLPASELSEQLEGLKGKVSIGGPVEKNSMFYLHRLGEGVRSSEHVVGDIFMGGELDEMIQLIKSNAALENDLRFFIGYSGWESGQLETEVFQNAWLVINDIDLNLLFDTHSDDLWKKIMQTQGKKFELFAHSPTNPQDN